MTLCTNSVNPQPEKDIVIQSNQLEQKDLTVQVDMISENVTYGEPMANYQNPGLGVVYCNQEVKHEENVQHNCAKDEPKIIHSIPNIDTKSGTSNLKTFVEYAKFPYKFFALASSITYLISIYTFFCS